MLLFFISAVLLIAGYFTYGFFVEKVLGIEPQRTTPAYANGDGVDFVPMPPLKVFLIQFLNIAGLGPIFGAVLGAVYGPVCLLWIVFGSIFAGAVHDYLSGMASVRTGGHSILDIVHSVFGQKARTVLMLFLCLFLLLVGAVFAVNPAKMLAGITSFPFWGWLAIIFGYYFIATMFSVDKIIGRLYPFFAILLLAMSCWMLIKICFIAQPWYPQLTFSNIHPSGQPVFPLLFITVACGALSGFHATQSPMMARCLTNEKYGRPCFYGTMILEGLLALMWATFGTAFYQSTEAIASAVKTAGQAGAVSQISTGFLGSIGGSLTIVAVVVLAVTSGDTAFRSLRLNIADFFGISQKKVKNRLLISSVIFVCGIALSLTDTTKLWMYFGWANQTLACITLWTITVHFRKTGRNFLITIIPAVFMTAVCSSYILYDKIGFSLSIGNSVIGGIIMAAAALISFFIFAPKGNRKTALPGADFVSQESVSNSKEKTEKEEKAEDNFQKKG